MLVAFYGVDFIDVVESMKREISSFHLNLSNGKYGKVIIRGAVKHIIAKLAALQHPVDTFVLLIDEARLMEQHIQNEFNYGKSKDVTGIVRSALLDETIVPGLNVALVISSLSLSPIGRTTSSRAATPMVLPPRLNEMEVVNDWWKVDVSDPAGNTFLLLAATVSNNPRCVELAHGALGALGYNMPPPNDTIFVNETFIKEFYSSLRGAISAMYEPVMPSGRILNAIVFQDVLLIDAEVMECIGLSTITNSLDMFQEEGNRIVPEASLAILWTAALRQTTTDTTGLTPPIVSSLDAIIGAIKKGSKPGEVKLGSVLEVALAEWLKVRFSVAVDYNYEYPKTSPLTLKRLLGLDKSQKILELPGEFDAPLWTIARATTQSREHNMTHLSRTQQAEFLAELKSIEVTSKAPVAIIRSAPELSGREDPWDVCIKALLFGSDRGRSSGRGRPFYVFLDCKSANETYNIRTTPQRLPSNGKQYDDLAAAVGDTIDYAFLYATTHEGVSFQKGNCFVMRRTESSRLFGPVWPLYRVARDVLERLNPQNNSAALSPNITTNSVECTLEARVTRRPVSQSKERNATTKPTARTTKGVSPVAGAKKLKARNAATQTTAATKKATKSINIRREELS
jgi:hypothetical protein